MVGGKQELVSRVVVAPEGGPVLSLGNKVTPGESSALLTDSDSRPPAATLQKRVAPADVLSGEIDGQRRTCGAAGMNCGHFPPNRMGQEFVSTFAEILLGDNRDQANILGPQDVAWMKPSRLPQGVVIGRSGIAMCGKFAEHGELQFTQSFPGELFIPR